MLTTSIAKARVAPSIVAGMAGAIAAQTAINAAAANKEKETKKDPEVNYEFKTKSLDEGVTRLENDEVVCYKYERYSMLTKKGYGGISCFKKEQ